jgi:hypothetical protein
LEWSRLSFRLRTGYRPCLAIDVLLGSGESGSRGVGRSGHRFTWKQDAREMTRHATRRQPRGSIGQVRVATAVIVGDAHYTTGARCGP